MYVLLSGLGTTLRDLHVLPLRRHVPLNIFYRLVKALLSLTKTVQSECNIIVYVRRDRTGVNYYCDVMP